MRSSLLLAAAAVAVSASPDLPRLGQNTALSSDVATVSEYFSLLSKKIAASRATAATPVCDLSKARLPNNTVAAAALPPPSDGLLLKHVAIGRGTQNYTCTTGNDTAAPAAVGAVATLFNASCLAAAYPDLLDLLPSVVLPFPLTDGDSTLFPSNLAVSGHHYFTSTTTPFFNLDTAAAHLGQAAFAKNASQAAPSSTPASVAGTNRGQTGEAAVPWLRLLLKGGGAAATDTSSSAAGLREVYRVQTAGGSAPATCAGMPASFQVQYAAQYWFYEAASS